jgi:hypothetical protein
MIPRSVTRKRTTRLGPCGADAGRTPLAGCRRRPATWLHGGARGHKRTASGQGQSRVGAAFVVAIGKPADLGAGRIEEPDRLLRVWSLLQATSEQLDWAAVPPEGVPGLQRQFLVIRRELLNPSQAAASSAGALRKRGTCAYVG